MVAEVIRFHRKNEGFDYSVLPSRIRDRARQLALWIKNDSQKAAYSILRIGEYFIEMKGELEHGEFQEWVEEACEISITHAENYMNSYRRFGEAPQVITDLKLCQTVIFQLASTGTPTYIVEDVIDRANSGAKIKVEEVKKLKAIHNTLLNQVEAGDPIAKSELQQEVLGRARELAKSRDRELSENDIIDAAQEVAGQTIKLPEPKTKTKRDPISSTAYRELEESCQVLRKAVQERDSTIDELRESLKNEESRSRSLATQLELLMAENEQLKGGRTFEFLVRN